MKIAIIGASGHGKVVAEIAELSGYSEIVFLDDDDSVKQCGKFPVVGRSSLAKSLIDRGYSIFVAIGKNETRKKLSNEIGEDNLVSIIHPAAVISNTATIGVGTVVMAGGIVNAGANIGKGCIINTSSSVDHDCIVSDFSHIAVGAHLAGTVNIGEGTWIGAGATVINNISITRGVVVGAGAVVVKDIDVCGTYIGVPAKMVDTNIQ